MSINFALFCFVWIATCNKDQFRCGTGECIPDAYKCDGYVDCPGHDDEHEDTCGKLF